jgi:glycosyltransferase involved in cell wall biosynthesis
MRVLQVNTERTWRGGERQTLYTLEGLISQGIDCQLMALKNSLMHQRAIAMGISVIAVESMMDALKKLSNLKGDFDLIHAQTGKAHTQCILTKVLHQIPVIYTRRVNYIPSSFLSKLKYKYTDQVVSISNAISKTLTSSGASKNSPVIYSAIKHIDLNSDKANQLIKDLKIDKHTKIIGIISAFELEKDINIALKTINLLRKARNDFIVLHFGNGSLFQDVSDDIKSLDLISIYYQMGHVDNVEDFYEIMDVFLMTSKEEGLGSVILDAFTYQVSVVSTNAGGLNDLVKDRGYLCDIGDAECLSEGLDLALNASSQSTKWKASAKTYCDNEMGVDLMTSKYIALYQELING